jgi:hypothetical protein
MYIAENLKNVRQVPDFFEVLSAGAGKGSSVRCW